MRSARLGTLLLSATLLAAACGGDGTGPGGPSWFRASLSGEVTGDYEGTGDFASLRDDIDTPRYFMIFSESKRPLASEKFYLRWPGSARPGEGTYPLVPHRDMYGSTAGVTGVYLWQRGDNVSAPAHSELYVATEGTVHITRSTRDEVEGTIRFTGILVEKAGPWGYIQMDPRHRPDPASPKIEVTGTFRVTRWDEDDIVVITT